MSRFADELLAASKATVDGVDLEECGTSLKDEVGALLGTELDRDTIRLATHLAKGILATQTEAGVRKQVAKGQAPDLLRAGDTACTAVYLCGVAAGLQLQIARYKRA